MFTPTRINQNSKPAIICLVILTMALTSVRAFAESTTVPANETNQANQTAQPNQPIQRKYSTTQKSEKPGTHRVFKDDYERLLVKANKAEPPKIIWLKENQQKPRKAQTERNWLAQKGRSN